jgi:O-antigen ligase
LLVVAAASGLAFLAPITIPLTTILIAPLLGQTSDSTIGPLNAIGILSLWLLLFGGLAVIGRWREVLKQKPIAILLLLNVVTALSILPSASKMITATETLRMAAATVMLPLVFVLTRREKSRRIIVYSIIASSIVPLSVGLYQKLTGSVDYGHTAGVEEVATGLKGIYSTFWDIHPFAKYLMILSVVLAVFSFLKDNYRLKKLIALSLLFISIIELVYTYSRSQLIGFVVAILVILFAARKLNIKTILLLALVFFVLFSATGIFARFSKLFQPLELGTSSRVNTLKTRIGLWTRGFPLAAQRPFTGHGADTFKETLGIMAHNDYLGLFFDFGIIGPILYISFLYSAARKAWDISRSRRFSPFDRHLALAVLGITVAIAVLSSAENMARDTGMWWLHLALLGCMLGAAASLDQTRAHIEESTS